MFRNVSENSVAKIFIIKKQHWHASKYISCKFCVAEIRFNVCVLVCSAGGECNACNAWKWRWFHCHFIKLRGVASHFYSHWFLPDFIWVWKQLSKNDTRPNLPFYPLAPLASPSSFPLSSCFSWLHYTSKLIPMLYSDRPPLGTECLVNTYLNEAIIHGRQREEDFLLAIPWFVPFAQTSSCCRSGTPRGRKNEVYLKVIYFCCRFVGWRGSDKCKLVVYEAWLNAGRAALWGCCSLSLREASLCGMDWDRWTDGRRTHPLLILRLLLCSSPTFRHCLRFHSPVSLLISFTSPSVLCLPPSSPVSFSWLSTLRWETQGIHSKISSPSPRVHPSCPERKRSLPSVSAK